jgi:hypothetical protein
MIGREETVVETESIVSQLIAECAEQRLAKKL